MIPLIPHRLPLRLLAALAVLASADCRAAAGGAFVSRSAPCTPAVVGSTQAWTCASFDTKVGLLVRVDVALQETSVVRVGVYSSQPAMGTVHLSGTFEFDIGMSSLAFPFDAVADIEAGPLANPQNMSAVALSGHSHPSVAGSTWLAAFQQGGSVTASAETLVQSITAQPGTVQSAVVESISANVSVTYVYVPTVQKDDLLRTLPKRPVPGGAGLRPLSGW